MKKLMMVLLLLLLVGVVACGKKVALTADEFKSKMETKGYEVLDITDQYDEGTIEAALIAMKDDYQIEFYVVNNDEQAIRAYNQNKDYFEELKVSGSIETETSVTKNAKYTLTSAGRYMVVARVDNTFLYADVDSTHKSEVSDDIKDLGY